MSIKKSLFPVQRVAKVVASRAAAIFFFYLGKKIWSIFGEKKKENVKSPFFLVTRPLHRKHNYCYGQPHSILGKLCMGRPRIWSPSRAFTSIDRPAPAISAPTDEHMGAGSQLLAHNER